jgi:hypothetical protein
MTGLKVVNAGIRRFSPGSQYSSAHTMPSPVRRVAKLAARQRRDADAQFDHLRQMIERLERNDDPVDFVMLGSEGGGGGWLRSRSGASVLATPSARGQAAG